MSQVHLDRFTFDLNVGESHLDTTPEQWGVTTQALLAIPDEYTFVDDDTYCPQSDVPDVVCNPGVHYYEPGKCCIAIDNGEHLSVWLLVKE